MAVSSRKDDSQTRANRGTGAIQAEMKETAKQTEKAY